MPRPETELLAGWALELLPPANAPVVIDVGTGSGCIACALACERPDVRVLALDVSPGAVALARDNVAALGLAGCVTVEVSDLFAALGPVRADLIVSNPPYLPSEVIPTLAPEVSRHDPRLALDGGPDGLAVIRRLVDGRAPVAGARRLARAGDRGRRAGAGRRRPHGCPWLHTHRDAPGPGRDRSLRGRRDLVMPARLIIEGGVPLKGEVAASAAKNAALPALAAALLTPAPVTLDQRPRPRGYPHDAQAVADARRHRDPPGPGGDRHRRARRQRSGAVRAGLDHARLGARAGPARGPPRLGPGGAAGRLCHRRAADRPAPQGAGRAGRRDRHRERLRGGPGPPPQGRAHRDRPRHRDRNREPHDGRRARRGDDGHRERRPRAGGRRPGRAAHGDGRAPARRGDRPHRDRGRARAGRRGAPRGPRPHRGRHAAGGGGDHAGRRPRHRHGPRPRGGRAEQARGVRRRRRDGAELGAGARAGPAAADATS